jgi:hypothetical protein
MFDLKLTDIFSTLCIGILSVALITYFYFIINKFFVKDKFDNDLFLNWLKSVLSENYKDSGYMILALVAVFCLGNIAGDLTGRMTDSDNSHKNLILTNLRKTSGMSSQEDNRIAALIDTSNARAWRVRSLGKAVLTSPAIVANANRLSETAFLADTTRKFSENWAVLLPQLQKDKKMWNNFKGFLQQIYYTGKNWCFSKEHEPLNELKSIQNRIDLSRSMTLLMTFSLLLLAVIVAVNAMYVGYLSINNKAWKFWSKENFRKGFYIIQGRALILFFVIQAISKECYDINQENYNKRAYGYYVSEINKPEYLKGIIKIAK